MSADKHPAEVLADNLEWQAAGLATDAQAMLRRVPALEAERDEARRTVRMAHDLGTAIAAERDQLRAEVEALRADAERYRWLRDNPWPPGLESIVALHRNVLWDASIDAARKQQ